MKPPTVSARIEKVPARIDKNRHVRDYLAYYTALPYAPRHAVLINGPWGVGKTYLVKAFLQQHVGQNKKYIYISLYGLTTIDEIAANVAKESVYLVDTANENDVAQTEFIVTVGQYSQPR